MQTSAFLLVIAARAGGITRSTGFLLSLLGTAACMAQGSNDASYQSYRCVVLADGGACQAWTHPPQARVEERLEPGSYALYLMYLGRSQGDALASAARAVCTTRPALRPHVTRSMLGFFSIALASSFGTSKYTIGRSNSEYSLATDDASVINKSDANKRGMTSASRTRRVCGSSMGARRANQSMSRLG